MLTHPLPQLLVPGEIERQSTSMDELIITHRDAAPQFLTLDKPSLLIGRDENSDIQLDGQAISRQHARIERTDDGWRIVDLGSTNGSYLGGARLEANSIAEWQSGHPLQVGAFTLQWQSTQDATGGQTLVLMPEQVGAINQILQPQPDAAISVVLDTYQVLLVPGDSESIKIGLLSSADFSKQIVLEIDGVPDSWVELSQTTVTLLPKKHQSVTLTFSLPASSPLHAAKRRFTLTLRNTQEPQFINTVTGSVNIEATRRFNLKLSPKQIENRGRAELLIMNDGNISTEYRVNREPAGHNVRVAGSVWDVSLMPSAASTLIFEISAENRPLFGSPSSTSYQFTVSDSDGKTQSASGELSIQPVVPAWMIGAAAVLLTILVVLLLLFT